MARADMEAGVRELKPCPFCGGRASFGMMQRIGCKCGARVFRDTKAEAIAAWNQRTPDQPNSRVDQVMPTGNTMEKLAEDRAWLVRQLEAWPTRVDEKRTTNIEFLMKSAAALPRSERKG